MEEVQEQKKRITDADILAEWRSMLNTFAETIKGNPPVEDVKEDLEELMDMAKNTFLLTGPQKDAICARCRNYINGVYGVNKVKTDYLNKNA